MTFSIKHWVWLMCKVLGLTFAWLEICATNDKWIITGRRFSWIIRLHHVYEHTRNVTCCWQNSETTPQGGKFLLILVHTATCVTRLVTWLVCQRGKKGDIVCMYCNSGSFFSHHKVLIYQSIDWKYLSKTCRHLWCDLPKPVSPVCVYIHTSHQHGYLSPYTLKLHKFKRSRTPRQLIIQLKRFLQSLLSLVILHKPLFSNIDSRVQRRKEPKHVQTVNNFIKSWKSDVDNELRASKKAFS